MIFHILVTVFFFGFALLIGILTVMRGLYSFSICQPPLMPSDSAARVSLDEDREQPRRADLHGGQPAKEGPGAELHFAESAVEVDAGAIFRGLPIDRS
jgi:hypothetical protein